MLVYTQQLHFTALKTVTVRLPPLPLSPSSPCRPYVTSKSHAARCRLHRMELSSQMLVNCFASRKGKGKGWRSGGRGRETDVRNQRDPCCHVWMQHWLRSEERKGKREGQSCVFLTVLHCAVWSRCLTDSPRLMDRAVYRT